MNQVQFEVNKVTKCSIFSNVCSVYDPLGLINPISIQARVVAQSCWSLNLQWDSLVPEAIKSRWIEVVDELEKALCLNHPRYIGISDDKNISLHVFADAGEKSLGVVAYLVHDTISTLLTSKTKVCPLKFESFTITHKELVAMSVTIRLAKFIITF